MKKEVIKLIMPKKPKGVRTRFPISLGYRRSGSITVDNSLNVKKITVEYVKENK